MAEISIQHFVAYLSYNNNRGALHYSGAGAPRLPNDDEGFTRLPKADVEYSNTGMAVFYFRHNPNGIGTVSFGQKLEYYRQLHQTLKQEFGRGLSLALAPHSDCSDSNEMAFFCAEMKKLDATIPTIIHDFIHNYRPRILSPELKDVWDNKDVRAQSLFINEGDMPSFEGLQYPLPKGLDYLVNIPIGWDADMRIHPTKLVNTLLDLDPKTAPQHKPEDGDWVNVRADIGCRIQEIADAAILYALDPSREEELDNMRVPYHFEL